MYQRLNSRGNSGRGNASARLRQAERQREALAAERSSKRKPRQSSIPAQQLPATPQGPAATQEQQRAKVVVPKAGTPGNLNDRADGLVDFAPHLGADARSRMHKRTLPAHRRK